MKVVILCGGKGTRLKEETEYKPKPLVTVGGMPLVWHIMKIYSHYGFRDFILCLGYKGDMIKDYFLHFEELTNDFTLQLRNNTSRIIHHDNDILEDWNITFVNTGMETQTGGRIARIKHLVDQDEDFFLTYGDGVCDVRIPDVYDLHKKTGAIVTVTGVQPATHYGILDVQDGMAKSFKEKPHIESIINGGFKVCNRNVFDYITEDKDCIFEQEPLQRLAREGKLAVHKHTGFWYAMDTSKQHEELNAIWNAGNPPWKVWDHQPRSFYDNG
ncbi:MAG: glucose-1-phosphate cytidylyltransferase [Patescibacteria group bacterium]